MHGLIRAGDLRARLPDAVAPEGKGTRSTVPCRSRSAFRAVAVGDEGGPLPPLAEDSVFRAPAVGRGKDGRRAADHDLVLYPR